MTTRELSAQQLLFEEQSYVGKKIIDFKKGNITVEYPFASEKALIESITSGDSASVHNMFSKYFEDIMVFEDGNLKKIAEAVHLNPSYLSSLFKSETGLSFTDYLAELRLSHACELLTDTNRSITEVMLESGFTSQSYFAKVFRKKYGLTPKEYRLSGGKNKQKSSFL